MTTVLITKQDFDDLKEDVKEILRRVNTPHTQTLSEQWLDIQDTCNALRVSKRTLQSYRDNGVLPFSQIGGKIYFKVGDIEKHLENHYKPAFARK
jgi:hypothetical protein